MPLTEEQLITKVRNKTTDDVVLLPDAKILEFAEAGGDNDYGGEIDLNGVLYDAWVYIARQHGYMSEGVANLSVSQPVALRNAEFYRRLSGKAGAIVVVGSMSRADLLVATDVEWGEGD